MPLHRLILAAMLLAHPALGQALDDYLVRGYSVAAATRLNGPYGGCARGQRLVFADGSVFLCGRTVSQQGFAPRVTILRLAGEPPSVLLIGARPYAGQLVRLRLHDYTVPLRMRVAPWPPAPAAPVAALAPGRALGATLPSTLLPGPPARNRATR